MSATLITCLAAIAAIVITAIVCRFYFRGKQMEIEAMLTAARREAEKTKAELEEKNKENHALNSDKISLSSQSHALEATVKSQHEHYERMLEQQRKDFELQKTEWKKNMDETIAFIRKQHQEEMIQQAALVKEQFSNSSERILNERQKALDEANRAQMDSILAPLREQLRTMKEAVEQNNKERTETIVGLRATIEEQLRQSAQLGEKADNLAKALTGSHDTKMQGDFGEMRLRTLLEDMGLQEGVQFEEQATLTDTYGRPVRNNDDGKMLRPDVVLHFPDERDVIIDSKVSLTAFQQYCNAENENEKADALAMHLKSVEKHIDELARKDYQKQLVGKGHAKLDFVIMYVFSEAALQTALAADPGIWKRAYDKRVIICGSQNLYALLRVLMLSWRQMLQVENQEKMMEEASRIVERVQDFYDRLLKVDKLLGDTQKAFDALKLTTGPQGRSIITSARKLMDFGAQANQKKRELPALEEEDE